MNHGILETSPLRNLFTIREATTRRASSWDRTGGNDDNIRIDPGQTATLFEVDGPGCITHFYWTTILHPRLDLRRAVLRMYWDGVTAPAVEAPLGDFFGAANCIIPTFASQMLTVNLGAHLSFGFNCYFPMPFSRGARITLTHEGDRPFAGGHFWYHIEYERYDQPLPDEIGRFHAIWRRECPTRSADAERANIPCWEGINLTGADNYVILDAEGTGQLAGMLLHVDNVAGQWWGEGDDMIFVDGEPFPPRYHGTGTEEIFGGGACPNRPYAGPYTGFATVQNANHSRNNTMYRWYVHDPIRFRRSLRVTIEHGHANNYENDYSSVAYWYQRPPSRPFGPFPPLQARLPLPCDEADRLEAILERIRLRAPSAGLSDAERARVHGESVRAQEDLYQGRWREALERLAPLVERMRETGGPTSR